MAIRTLAEKLDRNIGPKRILALDGGGVRGILTLGILKHIEDKVKKETGDNSILLGDYYDLIGGTSTGAIIACGLATGKSVDEIIELYKTLGKEIFGNGRTKKIIPRSWTNMRAVLNENYSSERLEEYLQDVFKEIHISDTQNIKCGLAINSKRADTYSLWTVANHPKGIYYKANSDLKLWELCRASSAAPYYFKPKKLHLRRRNDEQFDAAFIDGGVSLANNPAWQTYLTATVPSFGFNWKSGENEILITSLGTGNGSKKEDPDKLVNERSVSWATKIPDLFMTDALEMNEIIMHIAGHNIGPKNKVDSQFDDLSQIAKENHPLFSYQRYNFKLQSDFLQKLSFKYSDEKIKSLKEMDHFENMDDLLEIGLKYGKSIINNFII